MPERLPTARPSVRSGGRGESTAMSGGCASFNVLLGAWIYSTLIFRGAALGYPDVDDYSHNLTIHWP